MSKNLERATYYLVIIAQTTLSKAHMKWRGSQRAIFLCYDEDIYSAMAEIEVIFHAS